MKNNIDSNFAIAILVLVAACVGFAFVINSSQEKMQVGNTLIRDDKDNAQKKFVETQVDYSNLSIASLGNTSSWKNFSDKEVGISFRVPQDWTIRKIKTRTTGLGAYPIPCSEATPCNVNSFHISGSNELIHPIISIAVDEADTNIQRVEADVQKSWEEVSKFPGCRVEKITRFGNKDIFFTAYYQMLQDNTYDAKLKEQCESQENPFFDEIFESVTFMY